MPGIISPPRYPRPASCGSPVERITALSGIDWFGLNVTISRTMQPAGIWAATRAIALFEPKMIAASEIALAACSVSIPGPQPTPTTFTPNHP